MEKLNDELITARNKIMKDIIGEIVVSDNVEDVLRKWRSIFKISQKDLAQYLGITSSVISDYESGRRKSPGIKMIKRYIEGLIEIDIKRGGEIIKTFIEKQPPIIHEGILDIKEFISGVKLQEFCKHINADVVVSGMERDIFGYTVIDSIKTITRFSTEELINVYGSNTQRALIFTGVSTGRGPMIAIKLTNLKPSLVVMHGIGSVDEIAKRIAEVENIPLAICRIEDINTVIERLRNANFI